MRDELLNRRPPKQDLDEQQKENINRALNESKQLRMPAKFLLYDPYEELEVSGIVEQVDRQTKTFKVDGERFKIEDILSAEVED
jgi:hypothetical protein